MTAVVAIPPSLIALALAYYQNPIRYQNEIKQGHLPEQMTLLLQIAAELRSANKVADSYHLNVSELQKAAQFFIQQVLLAATANHYQVLGLQSDANAELIKKHYHLLIRLFHPDRHQDADAWTDIYAQRVNYAYNTLRDAHSRQQYDYSISRQSLSDEQFSVADWKTQVTAKQVFAGTARQKKFNPRQAKKYPVSRIIASLFAVLVTVVMVMAAFNNQTPKTPEHTPETANQRSDTEVAETMAVVNEDSTPRRKLPPPQQLRSYFGDSLASAAYQPAEQSSTRLPVVQKNKPVVKKIAIRQQAVEQQQIINQKPAKRDNSVPQPDVETKISSLMVQKKAGQKKQQLKTPLRSPAPSPVAEVVLAKPKRAFNRPLPASNTSSNDYADQDFKRLPAKFARAYQSGSLTRLLRLFDRTAVAGNVVGKAAIGRDYGNLFLTTTNRHMQLSKLRWQKRDQKIIGSGRFNVLLQQKNNVQQQMKGRIRFTLKSIGQQWLIKNLDINYDREPNRNQDR